MRAKDLFLLLMVNLVMNACIGSNSTSNKGNLHHIIDADIKNKDIEIIDLKSIDGYLTGVSWEKNEIYVDSSSVSHNRCLIRILNPLTGEEKKKISFPRGDPQSPTHFSSPSYIEYLDGEYYVFDHIYKIVAYDIRFNYLFTGMFYNRRIFVDFYTYNNDVYYLFGRAKNLREKFRYNIESYKLIKGSKPNLMAELSETFHESPYPRNGDKYYYIIFFRSSVWGFEQEGSIFYSDNRENKYYRYNIRSKKTEIFELPYLKAKVYKQEEAEKAAHYKNMDRTVRGLKTISVPAVEATFHQGLYSVGKNKIGLVTDIDMSDFTFRLDIFDSLSGQYRFSIRLAFGEGFLRRTSSQNLGYLQTYINIDLGLYVWPDLGVDISEGAVKITLFKQKSDIGKL
jgi:hypothetical protein